jgi:hypothetical protein
MKQTKEPSTKRENIGSALAKFQSRLKPAVKGSDQSFFKGKDGKPSKYADLNSIIDASKEPKEESGIAFSLVPNFSVEKLKSVKTTTKPDGSIEVIEKEDLRVIEFVSAFVMVGDDWLEGRMTIKTGAKGPDDPQAMGSGLTYLARYMQSRMLNIGTADGEDDDGEATMNRVTSAAKGNSGRPVAKKVDDLL